MQIPTNEQILARLKGKPIAKAPAPIPSLKLPSASAAAPVSPATSNTKLPTPFANTKTGIALNTLNPVNLAKATGDLYGPLVNKVGGVFKDIARGTAAFGASVVEAAPRIVGSAIDLATNGSNTQARNVVNATPTYKIPILGDVESIQTKAIKDMRKGQPLGPALLNATGEALLDEPTGIALKPVFLAGGMIFKQFAKQGLEPLAQEALKHETPEAFQQSVKAIQDTVAAGKPLLPEQQKIAQALKNGGKDFNLDQFYGKVKTAAEKEAAATAAKTVPTETPVQKVAQETAPELKPPQTVPEPTRVPLRQTVQESEPLLNDISKVDKSQDLNLDHLKISDEGKTLIKNELDGLGSQIEKKTGEVLTHKEITATAEASSKILKSAAGREQTAAFESAVLNLRRTVAAQAETGTVTREFLENLVTLKSVGTDIARKLGAFAIEASPREMTGKQAILDQVLKLNGNVEDILKAAKGVDFNDSKQAIEFYRKFIAPKKEEWLDLLRYNSMLSSPKTHLINTMSNLVNSSVVPALSKAIRGGFDFLASSATGSQRKYYAGEAGAYLKAYVKNIKAATQRFGDVWKGNRDFTNLDYRSIPLATKGVKGAIEKFLRVPTTALEAADQFFMQLVKSGELAGLEYRAGKGVSVPHPELQSEEAAKYLLYREGTKGEVQGHLLNAMDTLTNTVQNLRSSENPLIRWPAKLTFPFIATPTNIFKQGLEFSPLGFATIPGAKNQMEQAVKATIGTGIAIAGGTLIASNRLTWGEPTAQADKNAFRESGMQPYSIKLGNRWYSYQKLPPFLAFPLSMIAVVGDAVKNKKIDDGTADVILSSFAKYASFLSDQSYFKSMGDLWAAINGDEYATSRLIGNYPQQFIPYRALTGWLARLTDPSQRTISPGAGFIDRQVQLLMQQYPGLSQQTTPRLGPSGQPIENKDRVLNAFSPVQTIPQTPEQAADYSNAQDLKGLVKKQTAESATLKANAEALVEKAKAMDDKTAAGQFLSDQTKDNPQLAAKVKSVIAEQKKNYNYTEKLISQLGVENGQRAQYIVDHVQTIATKEEKIAYLNNLKEKGLISANVQKQIQDLLKGK